MREFVPDDVRKFVPLIAFGMAGFYAASAAMQMQRPIAVITKPDDGGAKATIVESDTEGDQQPEAQAPKSEPVHKLLIRMLNDLDDILDTIHDVDSFEAAKPRLLSRAREQRALAERHRNAGMTALNSFAQRELQPAMNRHVKSLTRAVKVVPAVNKFFNDELGPILSR